MTSSVVDDVVRRAGRVRDAGHLGAFKRAVHQFERALGEIPDEAAGSLSIDGAQALQLAAEGVIDSIEERVADTAKAADAQELVSDVYEIRRLLEEVSRWRQHYTLTARSL